MLAKKQLVKKQHICKVVIRKAVQEEVSNRLRQEITVVLIEARCS
jgi:hypothetical protein